MKYPKIIVFASVFLTFLLIAVILAAQDVPRISKEELRAMMEDPELVIIDVRTGRDWKSSELKIKASIREEPLKAKSWADNYGKDKVYVLYCA